jgi:rhodanese-related sulfurtransferase
VRSAQVINFLKEQWFENIYDLVWGTDIWEKQGNKLIKK